MSGVIGTLTDANQEVLTRLKNDVENQTLRKNQELGKDAFLKLMMTQLAHQDPLQPLDNKEMISQMAEFTSVEQMGTMSDNMEKTVLQNDSILKALELMVSQGTSNKSDEKIQSLIEKTDRTNELNTEILAELKKITAANAAAEAYAE